MKPPKQWLSLDREALRAQMHAWGEPAFRADQLLRWLYQSFEFDAQRMHNLPAALRQRVAAEMTLNPLALAHEAVSHDGLARKALFRLADGETIETVLMLYEERRTVCISTQAGCAMGCPFCATGMGGLARNLTPGEIVAQVLHYALWLAYPDLYPEATPVSRPSRVTNIVLMGMGEPLANYAAVWQALAMLTAAEAFGLGARHITLSTVGLVPAIDRMADEPLQIGLAVSLHAPDDALRDRLVPVNRRYPLAELMAACRRYTAKTGRRVTFEYALMAGVNDHPAQAQELAQLLRGLLCHVNLIPLNPVAGAPFGATSDRDAAAFAATVQEQGIPVTVRLRRGIEINAGCGQLRQSHARRAMPVTLAAASGA